MASPEVKQASGSTNASDDSKKFTDGTRQGIHSIKFAEFQTNYIRKKLLE